MNANSLLILYSAVLTAAGALAIGSGAVANDKVTRFAEIDVQRINVREADGTLRMIISNTDKSPGIYMHNKERPHPSGNRGAGIIFLVLCWLLHRRERTLVANRSAPPVPAG